MEKTNILNKEDIELISLGDLLRNNRENLNIKIQDISNFLKVRPNEIKLLENNDIEKIAKSIYIPGLIKSYGKYLNINADIIERAAEKRRSLINKIQEEETIVSSRDVAAAKFYLLDHWTYFTSVN